MPRGRDRLGFRYWRGYNFHMQYYGGWVNAGDWRNEQWQGYETTALARYAMDFMGGAPDGDETPAGDPDAPFCLFLAPHQPHFTPHREFAPPEYYARLPQHLRLPANVPPSRHEAALQMYRHYLAMTMAVDDMVGQLLDYLERTGQAEHTLVIFTSDHGTQGGAQDIAPWAKNLPYEESVWVPLLARLPGRLEGGRDCDALVAPVDFFPTLCGLCDVPLPRSVEGYDLSGAWLGQEGALCAGGRAAAERLRHAQPPPGGPGVARRAHQNAHLLPAGWTGGRSCSPCRTTGSRRPTWPPTPPTARRGAPWKPIWRRCWPGAGTPCSPLAPTPPGTTPSAGWYATPTAPSATPRACRTGPSWRPAKGAPLRAPR